MKITPPPPFAVLRNKLRLQKLFYPLGKICSRKFAGQKHVINSNGGINPHDRAGLSISLLCTSDKTCLVQP
jgi:hypothetical protein